MHTRTHHHNSSQTLCHIGADGVDALREELNCFFTTLVDAVHEHGGDIYKFAGDAIIVLWPQSRHFKTTPMSTLVNKAILCALQLVQVEHTITAIDKLIDQDTNEVSSKAPSASATRARRWSSVWAPSSRWVCIAASGRG